MPPDGTARCSAGPPSCGVVPSNTQPPQARSPPFTNRRNAFNALRPPAAASTQMVSHTASQTIHNPAGTQSTLYKSLQPPPAACGGFHTDGQPLRSYAACYNDLHPTTVGDSHAQKRTPSIVPAFRTGYDPRQRNRHTRWSNLHIPPDSGQPTWSELSGVESERYGLVLQQFRVQPVDGRATLAPVAKPPCSGAHTSEGGAATPRAAKWPPFF